MIITNKNFGYGRDEPQLLELWFSIGHFLFGTFRKVAVSNNFNILISPSGEFLTEIS